MATRLIVFTGCPKPWNHVFKLVAITPQVSVFCQIQVIPPFSILHTLDTVKCKVTRKWDYWWTPLSAGLGLEKQVRVVVFGLQVQFKGMGTGHTSIGQLHTVVVELVA